METAGACGGSALQLNKQSRRRGRSRKDLLWDERRHDCKETPGCQLLPKNRPNLLLVSTSAHPKCPTSGQLPVAQTAATKVVRNRSAGRCAPSGETDLIRFGRFLDSMELAVVPRIPGVTAGHVGGPFGPRGAPRSIVSGHIVIITSERATRELWRGRIMAAEEKGSGASGGPPINRTVLGFIIDDVLQQQSPHSGLEGTWLRLKRVPKTLIVSGGLDLSLPVEAVSEAGAAKRENEEGERRIRVDATPLHVQFKHFTPFQPGHQSHFRVASRDVRVRVTRMFRVRADHPRRTREHRRSKSLLCPTTTPSQTVAKACFLVVRLPEEFNCSKQRLQWFEAQPEAMLTKGLRMVARILFAMFAGSGSRRQRIAPRRVFGFRVRVASLVASKLLQPKRDLASKANPIRRCARRRTWRRDFGRHRDRCSKLPLVATVTLQGPKSIFSLVSENEEL
ncbi:hypothetical protein L596_016368 [Steinernema carpocapsae]|uniref:Uncharacterized protein n=1 Tax=Steinernema carpocapsae TaxID=34508 RepID=A0A4U5NIR8_STECR|nr:hypothetical protein L596_016368 [Steinernema carpocapsae]